MPEASTQLGVLPLAEFDFALEKGEFKDGLSLRCKTFKICNVLMRLKVERYTCT